MVDRKGNTGRIIYNCGCERGLDGSYKACCNPGHQMEKCGCSSFGGKLMICAKHRIFASCAVGVCVCFSLIVAIYFS